MSGIKAAPNPLLGHTFVALTDQCFTVNQFRLRADSNLSSLFQFDIMMKLAVAAELEIPSHNVSVAKAFNHFLWLLGGD